MSIKKFLSGVSCVALLALAFNVNAVEAADIPMDPVPEATSWTGPYIGAFIGAGAAVTEIDIGGFNFNGVGGEGIIVGGIIGYNFQVDSAWVIGLEGELGYYDLETTASLGPFKLLAEPELSGSISARAGWLMTPSSLLYVIGGWTWQDWKTKISTPGPSFKFKEDYDGWHLGAGIETKITNDVSVRVEYRYTDLGDESWTVPGLEVEPSEHTGRIAVVWNFGNLM